MDADPLSTIAPRQSSAYEKFAPNYVLLAIASELWYLCHDSAFGRTESQFLESNSRLTFKHAQRKKRSDLNFFLAYVKAKEWKGSYFKGLLFPTAMLLN